MKRTITCETCGISVSDVHDKDTRYCSRNCKENQRRLRFELARPIISEFSGKTKTLPGGIIVNKEYYDWLNQYRWPINDNGYAVRMVKVDGKLRAMRIHRLIMEAQPGQIIDHINRNKLDNTVANLRFLTARENSLNSHRTDNAKYYFWNKQDSKWVVRRFGKRLASFKTEGEAIDYVEKYVRNMEIPEWGNMYKYRKQLETRKLTQGMTQALPVNDR